MSFRPTRPLSVAMVVVLLLGVVGALVAAPSPARAAAKHRTCKTVKRHGKKVKVCSGKPARKPTPAPTSAPTPTPTPTISLPVNPSDGLPPVTVAPHADASRAATQTIGSDGGSISATGADGTVYTLQFQKNSLDVDTAITLTPLAGADGLPGGHGLAAGVQLDPQGLQLVLPATLTIKLAAPIPVTKQISFASTDAGADFHLYPQTYDPSTITMEIDHFTEYGTFAGSPADLAGQLQHGTQSYLSLIEQLQAALKAVHEAEVAGVQEPFTPDQLEAIFVNTDNAWYEQKILPQMQAAAQPDADDNQMTAAIKDAFAWQHQVELIGLGDKDGFDQKIITLNDLVGKALNYAYDRAVKRCTDGHDILQIGRILQVEHNIELLGVPVPANHNFDDAIRKCVSFELDVDTTLTRDYHINNGFGVEKDHVQVQGLQLQDSGGITLLQSGTLSGQKNPVQLSWSKNGGNCAFTLTRAEAASPFTAQLHLAFTKKPDGTLDTPTVSLLASTGDFQEAADFKCPEIGSSHFPWDTFVTGWNVLHGKEAVTPINTFAPQAVYNITGWTYLGGAVWATKTYNQTMDEATAGGKTVTWTESTTLTLRHVPLQ